MKKDLLYSKKFKILVKIFSIISMCFALISDLVIFKNYSIFSYKILKTELHVILFYINLISFVLLFFLFLYPLKLGLITFITFSYSFFLILYEPENFLGILMFLLTISVLLLRGFYERHKIFKSLITVIGFILPFLLTFLIKSNLKPLILRNLLYLFLIIIVISFVIIYILIKQDSKLQEKILDLSTYEKLTKRDAEWLNILLSGQSYKVIAIDNNKNIGTVKNRFKIIYDTLEVGDKTGFLNRYGDHQIIFSVSNDNPNKAKMIFHRK